MHCHRNSIYIEGELSYLSHSELGKPERRRLLEVAERFESQAAAVRAADKSARGETIASEIEADARIIRLLAA